MTLAYDFAATVAAIALFGGCVLPTGWLAARWLRIGDGLAAWSLLLGAGIVPTEYFLLGHLAGPVAAWSGLAALTAAAMAGFRHPAERRSLAMTLAGLRDRRVGWGLVLWAGVGWLVITDLPLGDRLSLSGVLIDYAKHISVTDALTRTGIPPVNPSFHPGEPVPLFYYYFWFLLCSLADQLGGTLVTAKHAVFAGTLWAGVMVVAAIRVHADLLPRLPAGTVTATATALLLVTGLDLLPFIAIHLHAALASPPPGPLPDLEWWNEQVTAWVSAVLWVPHHVAALCICLAAFRLVERGGRLSPAVAAVAFATALGMSVWVTLTAAVMAAAWCGVLLVRRERHGLATWIGTGLLSLVLALPFIHDLSQSRQGGGPPLELTVREFFPFTRAHQYLGLDISCGQLCRALSLPLNYGLEFGFFALTTVLYWRQRRRQDPLARGERLLLTQTAAALLFCSVVKSSVALNDLGWRGMMFVQFAALLWAVPVMLTFAEHGRWRPWLKAAAALGLAATAIQAVQLRLQPATQHDAELRRTYEWISANTPPDALLQHDPTPALEALHAVYGNRQVAFSDWQYGTLYGVDPVRAVSLRTELAALFAAPSLPAAAAAALAGRYGITTLVAKAEDPAWRNRSSWVWATPPRFATGSTRVIAVADLEALAGHRATP